MLAASRDASSGGAHHGQRFQNSLCWNDLGKDRDQHAIALDATHDTHQSAAGVLDLSQVCREVFRHAKSIEKLLVHYHAPISLCPDSDIARAQRIQLYQYTDKICTCSSFGTYEARA